MRYYRIQSDSGVRLVVETAEGAYDVTADRPQVRSYENLVVAADIAGLGVDEVARKLLEGGRAVDLGETELMRPLVPDEVWAAGVTYEISEEARQNESEMPEIYVDVYDADRPEIFFKATPNRTVGPGGSVGIRADSDWDVPEPELGLVLYGGEIVGYTIGNDMSSRDIEGQNPLYLPQAKVYERCCSFGPCVASPSQVSDPRDLEMSMEIRRDGETVFGGSTSTDRMVRTPEGLAKAYRQHNSVPEFAVLLTGTSLVPPDDFTLRPGDEIDITVEEVGSLSNDVVTV